jgi:hypothetical protein
MCEVEVLSQRRECAKSIATTPIHGINFYNPGIFNTPGAAHTQRESLGYPRQRPTRDVPGQGYPEDPPPSKLSFPNPDHPPGVVLRRWHAFGFRCERLAFIDAVTQRECY